MAVINNPVLGTIECSGCGCESTVHQTKRGKSGSLYTRCNECGVDQRNGPAVQARLYYGTRWREGAESVRPANVKDKVIAITSEPETTLGFEGEGSPKGSPTESEAIPKKRGKHIPIFVALGLGLVAILAP